MRKVVKREGVGNIALEEGPAPTPGSRQILVRNARTLISPGSEIGRRYTAPGPIDDSMMGYSAAGIVKEVGAEVSEYKVGDRVALVAPHAEYVIGDLDRDDGSWVLPIPDGVSFEQASFHPLTVGAVMWTFISDIKPKDSVVILGQGLVGLLMLQAIRGYGPKQIITTDAIDMRCRLSHKLGADRVINVRQEDPVHVVSELTGGRGAEVVVDCVGGKAGLTSFSQAQDMCRDLGRIHLIGLYHGEPLRLDASKIQRKLIIGGYYTTEPRSRFARLAMQSIKDRSIRVDEFITHQIPCESAKEGFDQLFECPEETLGVILTWD